MRYKIVAEAGRSRTSPASETALRSSSGFTAALRRSERAALVADDLAEHRNGMVISIPRSKTNHVSERTAAAPRALADRPALAAVRGAPNRQPAVHDAHRGALPDAIIGRSEYAKVGGQSDRPEGNVACGHQGSERRRRRLCSSTPLVAPTAMAVRSGSPPFTRRILLDRSTHRRAPNGRSIRVPELLAVLPRMVHQL